MTKSIGICLILVSLLVFTGSAISKTGAEGHESETHKQHHNHVAVFLGNTTQYENGNHYTSIGLDYVRLFGEKQKWGGFGFIEGVNTRYFQWVLGVGLVYKPFKKILVKFSPGIELVKKKPEEEIEIIAKMLIRLGVSYEFHVNRFTIAPTVSIDYIRNHPSLVYGVNFGFGF